MTPNLTDEDKAIISKMIEDRIEELCAFLAEGLGDEKPEDKCPEAA
jgi:hypothetical protein